MANGFNYIFKHIVEDDDDFVGMVAYTLYKRQKIEWIAEFERTHQRIPDDAEITAGFIHFSVMPSQVQIYRDQAVQLLDMFLDQALYAKVAEARDEIRNDAIVQAVKKSMLQGVVENLIAGFIAALITLAASGLIWVAMQGPENLIRQSIDKAIDKPDPDSAASKKQP